MTSIESRRTGAGPSASCVVVVALLAASLMSCMSLGFESRATDALQSAQASAAEAGAWISSRHAQMGDSLGRLRENVDGALAGAAGSAVDGMGEAARRARGRAIMASDACYSIDEMEGCAVAAKSACQRASYADGAPLASSSYVACNGSWSLRASDAPEGMCKTKRRLNAALCW